MANQLLTDGVKALFHSDPGLRGCFAVSRLMELAGTDLSHSLCILQGRLLSGTSILPAVRFLKSLVVFGM